MAKEKTTIQISNEVRDKLKAIGKKGQTYEDIITTLLDMEYKSKGKR